MKFCGEGYIPRSNFWGGLHSLNRSQQWWSLTKYWSFARSCAFYWCQYYCDQRKVPAYNKHLCLSASDSQTVLWCRYWWFDGSSTTHQHQAATLTTASSGCINGKVWRTVAKQAHASYITTYDGVLYQLCYCSSAFHKCWEQTSNFVPALTALLSLSWCILVTAYCCSSICLSARGMEGSVASEQCCWSQPYGTWKPPMTLSTSLSTSTLSTDTCLTISREYWGSKLLTVKITCKFQSCVRNSILWICVLIKLSASQYWLILA